MSAKLRNILMCVFTAVIIICLLTVSLTYGRYQQEADSGSDVSGEIPYNVSNKVEVSTVEELFVAIENGYSSVKVSDKMVNPLVVSSATVNVGSDLILDLNGHDMQRNNRDAMLNIVPNVSVTIIDSSTKQTGSLYNPVGSVLKVGGGTLTVAAGTFESGPRSSEYLSYKSASSNTLGTFNCPIRKKSDGYAANTSSVSVPLITPVIEDAGQGLYYANGNVYLDGNLSGYDKLFTNDTFLYYSIDDPALQPSKIYSEGSADFFYSYYVNKTVDASNKPTYSGAYLTKGEAAAADVSGNPIAVTVYGYNGVISSADEVNDFAAIKMEAGSLQVSGGSYISHFGVSTAYCVYASGGKMSIEDGSFFATDKGVCVNCDYQTSEHTLRINNGTFKSYHGDTIQMTSGRMKITGGTFVKDSTAYAGDPKNHNNSAINVFGGTIELESATSDPIDFYLAGYYMAAIRCANGATISSKGVNYQFGTTDGTDSIPGGNNMGIYSQGGNVTVEDCVFIQPGNYSYGIYSQVADTAKTSDAQINVRSSIFSLGGKRCIGINAEGGIINIGSPDDMNNPKTETITVKGEKKQGISIESYTMFYLDHVANCYGIYAAGDSTATTQINVYAGQFFIGSGTGASDTVKYADEDPDVEGAYVTPVSTQTLTKEELNRQEKVWSAGVYLNKNGASVGLGRVRMVIGGNFAAGVFAEQGTVTKLYGGSSKSVDAPTTVQFVGTRVDNYTNGGYNDAYIADNDPNKDDTYIKSDKWIYLYKFDSDYKQASDYETYYDRILTTNSNNEYGIAAKGGQVNIGRIYINLRSKLSRGIFASGSETKGNVVLENFMADIVDTDTLKQNASGVKVPEQLSTTVMTIRNGNVSISDAHIRTDGIGILLNRGELVFEGSGSVENNIIIDSVHTSPIYITSEQVNKEETVSHNNWKIEAMSKVSITCNLTPAYSSNDGTEPIPWRLNQGQEIISYNGVNIKGGSLESHGELVIDKFTGLNNKAQDAYDPYSLSLSSCAINVQKLSNEDAPEVRIWHAHVNSEVGGGISVKGGTVYLGKDPKQFTPLQVSIRDNERHGKDNNELITITTTGNERYTDKRLGAEKYSNWSYYASKTGGPAIKVADGSIEVQYGTFSAAQGNGILVSNDEQTSTVSTATIYDGKFRGDNTAWSSSNSLDMVGGNETNGSGLGSYYGFMLRGGGNLTIKGGTFEGFNGGAFVTGSNTTAATVNILGGTYQAFSGTTRTTNGFSVGYNANVTIGDETVSADAPRLIGYACGIAIENNGGLMLTKTNASITLRGGSYVEGQRSNNGDAIWKGNNSATLTLYECTLYVAGGSSTNSANSAIDGGSSWSSFVTDGSLKVYAKKNADSVYADITSSNTMWGYNTYVIAKSKPAA